MRRALVLALGNRLAELSGETLGAAGFEATDLPAGGGYLITTPRSGGLYSSPSSLALINGEGGYNALEIVTGTGQLTYNTNPVWHDGLYRVETFVRTSGNQIITGFLDIVGDLVGTRVQSYDGTYYGSTSLANMGPAGFSGVNGHVTLRPDGIGSDVGMLDVSVDEVTHDGVRLLKEGDVPLKLAVGTSAGVFNIALTSTHAMAIGLRAGGTFNVQATT